MKQESPGIYRNRAHRQKPRNETRRRRHMGSYSRREAEPEGLGGGSSSSEPWPQGKDYHRVNGDPVQHLPLEADDRTEQRSLLLAKAVEYEIIPRLMLAHRYPHECVAIMPVVEQIAPEDVLEFARQVLHEDDASLKDSVMLLRSRGIPVQSIFLDLLAPVARHLGELWERDLCDFTEVTVGLGRLQQVLRDNSADFSQPAAVNDAPPGRRILLAPCPGEQHTFGLSLVAEFFHRAGWDVSTNFGASETDPSLLVRQDWYDVVGFSLGGETSLARLAECMTQVRQTSLNPAVRIIAGGAIFALHPEYAAQISADAIITDGSAAPELAEKLVSRAALLN
jgi:methanogenic corrinoid protein MtbC1